MDKKDFSIEEALGQGWNAMKTHFWLFLGCLIVAVVVIGIPRGIGSALEGKAGGLSALFFILAGLIDMAISIGLIRIALKILDNEKPEFNDLFSFPKHFIDYLGASILSALIVLGGMILLLIPGIYWAIKFQFFGYCVVDQKLNPIEALRQSSRITQDVKWKLFGFGILLWLINILGVICLVVGLFVTIPTTLVAYAFVYRKLMSQSESVRAPEKVEKIAKKALQLAELLNSAVTEAADVIEKRLSKKA